MSRVFVSALLVATLAACSLDPTHACTLIGCDSGLTVHLAAKPASSFRVEVRVLRRPRPSSLARRRSSPSQWAGRAIGLDGMGSTKPWNWCCDESQCVGSSNSGGNSESVD
jgi:hypothetical protein